MFIYSNYFNITHKPCSSALLHVSLKNTDLYNTSFNYYSFIPQPWITIFISNQSETNMEALVQ